MNSSPHKKIAYILQKGKELE